MGKKLYLIVGASGSGKDYVVDKLCDKFKKKKVISRTTREKRWTTEDTHIFVSHEEAEKDYEKGFAKTIFNGNKYYTLLEDLTDADFYIIDPNGVDSINEQLFEMFSCNILFIKTPWYKRFYYMRKRGDSFKNIITRLKNDYKEFKDFKADKTFNSQQDLYDFMSWVLS